jgi:hypothetical protein
MLLNVVENTLWVGVMDGEGVCLILRVDNNQAREAVTTN